jgi:hypothetical protein
VRNLATMAMLLCAVFAVQAGMAASRVNADLADDIVLCGDKAMPKDEDKVCDPAGIPRGYGSSREEMRTAQQHDADEFQQKAILGGIGAALLAGLAGVAQLSTRRRVG